MISLPRRFAHRDSGAAVVEFALVLPMLLVVVVIIFDAGMLLYDKAVITNASREAARAGIVANQLTDSAIQAIATTYCFGQLVTFDSNNRICTTTISHPSVATGNPLTVTVTYAYRGMLLGTLIAIPSATNLTATTIMNYE